MPPRKAYPEMAGAGNSKPVPAPLKGLNTRDGHTSLQPDEARYLQNWLPDTQACLVRPGYANWCAVTGASAVPTLASYYGPSSSNLIGAGAGGLWDVTGTTAVNLVAASTYSSDRWQTALFNGYLYGFNGVDTPWVYNGSSVGATGFTGSGLTLSQLNTVSLVRGGNAGRLWFTQNGSADVWYGGSGYITGALTKFQLSQIAQGGTCVGIGSWSYDGGSGPYEQTVFIMSTGEILIYQGDPATTFSIVGTYRAPAPVSLAPWVRIGGELILLTVNGPMPVSYIFRGIGFDLTQLQTWGKIAPSWQADWKASSGYPGWSAHFLGGLVYFNVPLSNSSSKQYVLNTRIPAWTTYTNLPIASMADLNGTLYFGSNSDNHVNIHSGDTDNGAQISAISRQGFSYLFGTNRSSQFTGMRPNITANGSAQGQFQIDVDFEAAPITAPIINLTSLAAGAAWGAAWGSAWGTPPVSQRQFVSADGYGQAVAPVVAVYSSADSVQWYSTDVIGVQGGIL